MKGGRKNLKRASEEKHVTLGDGQCIMQVVSLRGSNLIEVLQFLLFLSFFFFRFLNHNCNVLLHSDYSQGYGC